MAFSRLHIRLLVFAHQERFRPGFSISDDRITDPHRARSSMAKALSFRLERTERRVRDVSFPAL